MSSAVECVHDAGATLGEGPTWCATKAALYWIDIVTPALHRFDPSSGASQSWHLPAPVGSFALRANGAGAVLALATGFAALDFADGSVTPIIDPENGAADRRFNDGKCDPAGRFWAGTMPTDYRNKIGTLYSLDAEGAVEAHSNGIRLPNGLAWRPERATF